MDNNKDKIIENIAEYTLEGKKSIKIIIITV